MSALAESTPAMVARVEPAPTPRKRRTGNTLLDASLPGSISQVSIVKTGPNSERPLPGKHLDLFPAGVSWSPAFSYRRRARALFRTFKFRLSSDVADLLLRVSLTSSPTTDPGTDEVNRQAKKERSVRQKSLGMQLVRDTFALRLLGLDGGDLPCALSAIDVVLLWHRVSNRILQDCKSMVYTSSDLWKRIEKDLKDSLEQFHLRHAFGTFMSISEVTENENLKQHKTTPALEALLSEFWNLAAHGHCMGDQSERSAKDEFQDIMKAIYLALMPVSLDKDLIEDGVQGLWLFLAKDDGTLPPSNFFLAIMRTVEMFCERPDDVDAATNESVVILSSVFKAISYTGETGGAILRPFAEIQSDCLSKGHFPVLPALQGSHHPLSVLRQYLSPDIYDELETLKYRVVGSVASMSEETVKLVAKTIKQSVKSTREQLEDALACHAESDPLGPGLSGATIPLQRLQDECHSETMLQVVEYAKSIGLRTAGQMALLDTLNEDVFGSDPYLIKATKTEFASLVELLSRLPVFSRLRRSDEPLKSLLHFAAQQSFFLREWEDIILDLLDDDPDVTLGTFCGMDSRKPPFSDKDQLAMRELRRTLIAYLANVAKFSPQSPRRHGSSTSNLSVGSSTVDLTGQAKENLGEFFNQHTFREDLQTEFGSPSLRTPRSHSSTRLLDALVSPATTRNIVSSKGARELKPPDPDAVPRMAIPGFPARHLPASATTPRGSRRVGGRYEPVQTLEERLKATQRLRPQSSIPTFVRLPEQNERIPVSPKVPPAIPIGTPRLRPRTANETVSPHTKQKAEDQRKASMNAIRVKRKKKRPQSAKVVYADDETVEYIDGVDRPTPRRIFTPPPLPRNAQRLKSAAGNTNRGDMGTCTSPRAPRPPSSPSSTRRSRPVTAPTSRPLSSHQSVPDGASDLESGSVGLGPSVPPRSTEVSKITTGKKTGRKKAKRKPKSKVAHLDKLGRRKKKEKSQNPFEYAYQDPTKTTTLKWLKNFGTAIDGPIFDRDQDPNAGRSARRKKGQLIDFAARRRARRRRVFKGPQIDNTSFTATSSHRKKDVYMPSDIRSTDQVIDWV
eukprot:TRINITY_DN40482_c0_g1_i1.p1 TRINITY_DN40482_c0_g1~~TRINITY_DN40482_c0_g1_i1.p1  ORF type:complete len:1075 (-),score=91.37 TRINITY_DN40482_c0_g1_i1:21-3245(-)